MFDCSCGITPTRADICFTAALRSVLAGCYTQVPHRSTLYRQNPPSLRPFPQIFPGTIYFIFFCTRMCIDGISATGVFSPNDLRPKTYISLDILVPVDRSDDGENKREVVCFGGMASHIRCLRNPRLHVPISFFFIYPDHTIHTFRFPSLPYCSKNLAICPLTPLKPAKQHCTPNTPHTLSTLCTKE